MEELTEIVRSLCKLSQESSLDSWLIDVNLTRSGGGKHSLNQVDIDRIRSVRDKTEKLRNECARLRELLI